jgi:hypothetical protein
MSHGASVGPIIASCDTRRRKGARGLMTRILVAWAFTVYAVIAFGYRVPQGRMTYLRRDVCEAARAGAAALVGPYEISERCEPDR